MGISVHGGAEEDGQLRDLPAQAALGCPGDWTGRCVRSPEHSKLLRTKGFKISGELHSSFSQVQDQNI